MKTKDGELAEHCTENFDEKIYELTLQTPTKLGYEFAK
jgi:hypothetical protein